MRWTIVDAVGVALCLLYAQSASTMDVAGTVTSVQDGDTLTFHHSAATYRVRRLDFDAPEASQPFGAQSTASLRELCQSEPATLEGTGTDRYGHILARVMCAGVDANAEQVRCGMWAEDAPMPLWEWRQSKLAR